MPPDIVRTLHPEFIGRLNMKRTHHSFGHSAKWLLIPVLILITLLAALPAAAQSDSTAQATLSSPEGQLTVGDPVALALSVTHAADQHVIAPLLEQNWGDFVIQDVSAPQISDNGDGSVTTSLTIDARLFAPGSFTTPPLTVQIADGAGQVVEIIAQPLTVNIASVLVEGDTELRDIKPQAELPYVNLIPWIVAGVALVIIAATAILFARRRRAKLALAAVDNRLPHEVALDELERIEGMHLPDEAKFKEHYSLISACLRVYMENRVNVPMIERTTAEIAAELQAASLPRPIAGQYVSLLEASDLVKFAKFRPDAANAYDALQSARQIVLSSRPVNITDQATGGDSGSMRPANPSAGAGISKNGTYQQMEVGA
jgi:hypothetical protein